MNSLNEIVIDFVNEKRRLHASKVNFILDPLGGINKAVQELVYDQELEYRARKWMDDEDNYD